jgi:hypothetical protein
VPISSEHERRRPQGGRLGSPRLLRSVGRRASGRPCVQVDALFSPAISGALWGDAYLYAAAIRFPATSPASTPLEGVGSLWPTTRRALCKRLSAAEASPHFALPVRGVCKSNVVGVERRANWPSVTGNEARSESHCPHQRSRPRQRRLRRQRRRLLRQRASRIEGAGPPLDWCLGRFDRSLVTRR